MKPYVSFSFPPLCSSQHVGRPHVSSLSLLHGSRCHHESAVDGRGHLPLHRGLLRPAALHPLHLTKEVWNHVLNFLHFISIFFRMSVVIVIKVDPCPQHIGWFFISACLFLDPKSLHWTTAALFGTWSARQRPEHLWAFPALRLKLALLSVQQ